MENGSECDAVDPRLNREDIVVVRGCTAVPLSFARSGVAAAFGFSITSADHEGAAVAVAAAAVAAAALAASASASSAATAAAAAMSSVVVAVVPLAVLCWGELTGQAWLKRLSPAAQIY